MVHREGDRLRQRAQVFGRPIGQNQGVQFPIARAYAEMRAAELMVREAADLFERGETCGAEANMAKLLAADASWEAAEMPASRPMAASASPRSMTSSASSARRASTRWRRSRPTSSSLHRRARARTAEVLSDGAAAPRPSTASSSSRSSRRSRRRICTARLADAGARVIKIERPEGDFARGYDDVARRARAPISSGSTAARNRWCSISPRPTTRRCSSAHAREGRRVRPEPQPGARRELGFADRPSCARAIRASSPARSRATATTAPMPTARPTTCWSRPKRASPRSPAARRRRRASASRSATSPPA